MPVSLGLLGGFELRQGEVVVDLPLSVQRLVAFLAMQTRPLQRLYVAGSLWLDGSEEHAAANLRTTLWRARRASAGLITCTPTLMSLSGAVEVDVSRNSQLARRLLSRDREPLEAASELGDLASQSEFLPDWYDDWVLIERERYRQLRLHALEALCEALAAAHRYGEAVEAGMACVVSEPLRESSHRALIQVYLAEGNTADAVRDYRMFRDISRNELGIEPSQQMRSLLSGIDDVTLA